MVILDELDILDISDQEIANKEVRGVHSFRNKENNQLQLLVFPEVLYKKNDNFSSSQNIPKPIVELMKGTEYFKDIKTRTIEEERNVLYVSFTRAKDYLVTLGYWIKSNDKKKPDRKSKYSWLVNCGASAWKVDQDVPVPIGDRFTLWHSAHPSTFIDLPLPETSNSQEGKQPQKWTVPELKNHDEKYQSPSTLAHGRKDGNEPFKPIVSEAFLGKKMENNLITTEDDNETDDSSIHSAFGTCVHHIFAAFDPASPRDQMIAMAERIINGNGFNEELPSPESVVASVEQLFGWLKEHYGEGTPLQELPFIRPVDDGIVIRGDMDLVWTVGDNDCVLVDYKNYGGTEDFSSPVAQSKYLGAATQLKAYKDTLIKGEYNVLDTLIYEPCQGRIVRLDF